MKKNYAISVSMLLLAVFLSGIFLFMAYKKSAIVKVTPYSQAADIKNNTNTISTKTNNIDNANNNESKEIKILFVGDLMFDRYIREVSQKKGNDFIFEKLKSFLAEKDLVVANLEGPITDKKSISIGTIPGEKNHLVFTFDPSLASTLNLENIKLVNIGNNHILNFGESGLVQTKNNLGSAGVDFFGYAGQNDNNILVKNINGLKIGFVNYNQFAAGSLEKTTEDIGKMKTQADIIIVYAHWGTEYQAGVGEKIKTIAHQFVDGGADMVIGSHPHVVEPTEIYRTKKIYYSLGNFIFDQYFSDQTKRGLAAEIRINTKDRSISFNDINLFLETNGQTAIRQ